MNAIVAGTILMKLTETEALGTFDEVVTTTEWHPVFKLITRRVTPSLTDERTYDDDGPSDTQLYTWTGPKLTSITNEVGHFTRITQHNIIGAPEVIEDPNGNITRLEYDSEHKLTAIIESDV